jgi:hypothetical protein
VGEARVFAAIVVKRLFLSLTTSILSSFIKRFFALASLQRGNFIKLQVAVKLKIFS